MAFNPLIKILTCMMVKQGSNLFRHGCDPGMDYIKPDHKAKTFSIFFSVFFAKSGKEATESSQSLQPALPQHLNPQSTILLL